MLNGHFIALRKAPFRPAKWPILECEMVLFSPWNGLNRNAKRAISQRRTYLFGLRYGVYHKTIWTERAFITSDLTFIHTSFAKIFCQNKVKKNCKFVSPFFPDNVCVMRERKHINIPSYEPEAYHALAVMDYLLREHEFIPNRSL